MRNLVSHGKSDTDRKCWSYYDNTTKIGYGPAYQNACIYSGSNDYSGGDTVWYNYVIASAGTIFDNDTSADNPADNTNPATESICPKGWTLPSNAQISSIGNNTTNYVSSFSPVLGGHWYRGIIDGTMNTYGFWWGSEPYNGAARYRLYYNTNILGNNYDYSLYANYIRCVVKKNTKTLSNLTYMQDMTPQTSFWTLVNGRSYDEV